MKRPKVIRADILGYCMGVRRAMEIAEGAVQDVSLTSEKELGKKLEINPENSLKINPEKRVFTFGPLIHNKSALENLEKQGLSVLDASEIGTLSSQDTVIIRAHGVPPVTRQKIEATGAEIIDATCPRVLSSQKRAGDFGGKGYTVILAGDKNHGEVAGIAGCAVNAGGKCIVVENAADALSMEDLPQKAILISQTTISRKEYDNIADVLKKRIENLQVFNTICPATSERQKSLEDLAKKVQGILVIGGKNSANTIRLFMMAEEYCKNNEYKCCMACHIEKPEEIPEAFFHLDTVGLTAGASTPDNIIEQVEEVLQNFS